MLKILTMMQYNDKECSVPVDWPWSNIDVIVISNL